MGFPLSQNHHHHHHNRYVSPHPPPPPVSFSDDRPNHYYPHLHQQRPLPPFPPPSHPILPPPPPPLPYNPHQSNFTFLDARNPSFVNHRRFPPPQSRVSNQSNRFDERPNSWLDAPRVPPEGHHNQPYLPYRPSDSYYNPRDVERAIPSYRTDVVANGCISRDSSNVVMQDQQRFIIASRDDDRNNRDCYVSARSERFSSDLEFGVDMHKVTSTSSRNMDDFVEKYEPRYPSMLETESHQDHHRDEDRGWVHAMEVEKNEFCSGGNDGVSFASSKEESWGHEYDLGEFSKDGECGEEFKQVQKKSVLLRIGKPNNTHRKRSHDYSDESNSCISRGKYKIKDHKDKEASLYLDKRMERNREGSPVDLDVSFKSNALVAKAVATTSSPSNALVAKAVATSSSPALEYNYTPPRNKKIRRGPTLNSPLRKFGEHSARSDSTSHGSESPSSSEKAPKQPREKDSVCDSVSLGDFGSVPSSGAVNASTSNGADDSLSGTVSDKGVSGGSDKSLSFRLKRKRKVFNLSSHTSIFQLTKREDEPITGESSKNHASAPTQGAILLPSLEESIDSEVDEPRQAIVSEKDGSEIDTVRLSQIDNEKNVSALSSNLAYGSNPSLHDIDGFDNEPTADKTLSEQKVSAVGGDLNPKPCPYEVPLLPENDTSMEYKDKKVSLGDIGSSVLSGNEEIEIQKRPTESYASVGNADNGFSSCNASTKTHDTKSLGSCLNEIHTVLPGYGAEQDSLDYASRKQEKSNLIEGTTNADSCNLNSGTTSSPNSSFMTSQVKIISSSCIVGDPNQHTCLRGASIFPQDGSKGSPNAIVIAGDNLIVSSGKSSEVQTKCSSPSETPENAVSPVIDVDASPCSSLKERFFGEDEVTEMGELISAAVQTPYPDHRKPSTDDGSYLLLKNNLPPSSVLPACDDGCGASATKSNHKSLDSVSDRLTNIVSTQNGSDFSDSSMVTVKLTDQNLSNQTIVRDDDNIHEKSVSKGSVFSNSLTSFVQHPRTSIKTTNLEVTGLLAKTKTASSASQGSNVKTQTLNAKLQGSKLPMKPASAVPRVFAGRSSSVFINPKINGPVNQISKPRTWHRSTSHPTSSVAKFSPIPVPPPPKGVSLGHNSYVRSGNTLVRKGAPATAISSGSPASTVHHLNSTRPSEKITSAGSGSKGHNTYSRTGGSSAPVVRPKTPPISGSIKLPDCQLLYAGDLPSSPLEHLSTNGSSEEASAPVEGNLVASAVPEYQKPSRTPEDQTGTADDFERLKVLDEGFAKRKIQYVKRKSNQLVAASSTNKSAQNSDQNQASSSDGYYKKRKNQLIRTLGRDDSVNTEVQRSSKIHIKRQAAKGSSKKYKHSRSSSVWTLHSNSLGKDGVTLLHRKMPHLFPSKRTRYWGNGANSSASTFNNNSSSSISRRLLLSRKRETIYTRSRHGFSLRMSKLLSVGASSLKWSKSIERNSKRANEEATLAVAAVEKKKREQHQTACASSEIKSRNNLSRNRIFRIGLVRYKMDPSKRTLERISDEEPSTSLQSKKETKRSYIPKRLLIGHDEYVRIGNGNQLVRNPKRRTRIFASQKVRWSLHTARSRLAKKRKYCQFFTRFGKCNKDDGKCPYIHDASKIAVCTKFLTGLCSNSNCNLTHKVIPERMQDCSYFLQGYCSNEHCPYRHVNVNSAASVCEGFLKGYCADGNECRKKHTYVCPVFEATGTCPQGSKCKLHHPKNRNKGLKRKAPHSTEQPLKNSRGRYFGSFSGMEAPDHAMVVSEKHFSNDNGDGFCQEGKFADFISLDFGDEEFGDGCDVINEQKTIGLGVADFDELTKPIGIMKKNVAVADDTITKKESSLLEDRT